MTASRSSVAVGLALLLQACAGTPTWTRRHSLPPPAQETRAGALARSTGPDSGSREGALPLSPALSPPGGGARETGPAATPRATSTANATANANATSTSNGNGPAPDVAAAVKAVSALVGQRQVVVAGVDYGPGCAALARAAFARAGRPLPAEARDAAALHALAQARGALLPTRAPSAGDLVFLADRPGGPPVHVGVVERAEADGTAVVLHRVARGVLPVRLNLAYPSRSDDPATGKHINDALRVGARAVPAGSLVVSVSDLLRRR